MVWYFILSSCLLFGVNPEFFCIVYIITKIIRTWGGSDFWLDGQPTIFTHFCTISMWCWLFLRIHWSCGTIWVIELHYSDLLLESLLSKAALILSFESTLFCCFGADLSLLMLYAKMLSFVKFFFYQVKMILNKFYYFN